MANPNYASTPEELYRTELFNGQLEPDRITIIELTDPQTGQALPNLTEALDVFDSCNQII